MANAKSRTGRKILIFSLIAVVAYYTTEKTNYRGLASVIGASRPDDLVVVGPVDERWPASITGR